VVSIRQRMINSEESLRKELISSWLHKRRQSKEGKCFWIQTPVGEGLKLVIVLVLK
jgi:hypothetical protein